MNVPLYITAFVTVAAAIVVGLAAFLDPPVLGLAEGPSPAERTVSTVHRLWMSMGRGIRMVWLLRPVRYDAKHRTGWFA